MAHLLIPTDLSDLSLKAAAFAVDLFGAEGNTFTLLHTRSSYGLSSSLVPGAIDLQRVEHDGLAELEQRLRAARDMTGAHLRRMRALGPLKDVVREAATLAEIDLVVMGTQGRSPVSYTGTRTTDVMLGARVPVLEIPVELERLSVRHILFGNDGRPIGPHLLDPLATLARLTNARITALHIATARSKTRAVDNTATFDRAFTDIAHASITVNSNDVEQALLGLAVRERVDLIAVLHRNKPLLERLFTPSTSKAVALHSRLPVLVLPS